LTSLFNETSHNSCQTERPAWAPRGLAGCGCRGTPAADYPRTAPTYADPAKTTHQPITAYAQNNSSNVFIRSLASCDVLHLTLCSSCQGPSLTTICTISKYYRNKPDYNGALGVCRTFFRNLVPFQYRRTDINCCFWQWLPTAEEQRIKVSCRKTDRWTAEDTLSPTMFSCLLLVCATKDKARW